MRSPCNNRESKVLKNMSDLESCTTSVDSESEGSLVDFIEHDDDEAGGDEDFVDEAATSEVQSGSGSDEESGSEDESVPGEKPLTRDMIMDDDVEVCAQYSPAMEQEGLITTSCGLRRSARVYKGRAPVRYVDEDYVGLMTSDVDSNVEWSSDDDDE